MLYPGGWGSILETERPMSYTLLSESWPVARKAHLCIWCGEGIPVGEKHRHERSIYEGNFQDHRWHMECDQAWTILCSHGEQEFEAHVNERPERSVI